MAPPPPGPPPPRTKSLSGVFPPPTTTPPHHHLGPSPFLEFPPTPPCQKELGLAAQAPRLSSAFLPTSSILYTLPHARLLRSVFHTAPAHRGSSQGLRPLGKCPPGVRRAHNPRFVYADFLQRYNASRLKVYKSVCPLFT